MKKLFFLLVLAAACGCSSVRICDAGGRTMVSIVNTGWYFLNLIPLASGSPDNPNGHTCALFRQTTTIENNMKLLDYAMRQNGGYASYRNLVSYTTDESVLFFLFKRRACNSSAELLKEPR